MSKSVLKTAVKNSSSLSVIYKSPQVSGDTNIAVPEAIFITDSYFHITGLNQLARSMYGLSREAIMGKFLFDFIELEKKGSTMPENIRELVRAGRWNGKMHFLVKQGNNNHFAITAVVNKNETGHINEIAFKIQIAKEENIQEKKGILITAENNEEELLHLREELLRQKTINRQIINTQEKERNLLSAEMHDNVNQLLMTSRLHIGAAKKDDVKQNELLEQAAAYLLMAVEEIRALSKKLNSNIIRTLGLKNGIDDICANLKQFNNITVTSGIAPSVLEKLSKDQQLMVFRIFQEQSNNILKYADASSAYIKMFEKNNQCYLTIGDNGKGFDPTQQKMNGIGFVNIGSRVAAFSGSVEIKSAPGYGCTLHIQFPIDV